jgi:protein gp37
MTKYAGEPRIIEKELRRTFKVGDFVFICDMVDWLGNWIPDDFIKLILMTVKANPQAQFLSMTKNPARYIMHVDRISEIKNLVLGSTIESNRDYPELSKAPRQMERIAAMMILRDALPKHKLFISLEPILDFDLRAFIGLLRAVKPWAVAVGYDNYNNKLPEPELSKTLKLITEIEQFTQVFKKTLRERA